MSGRTVDTGPVPSRNRLPITSVASSPETAGMNRVLRQDATLAVAWLRWAPWLGLAAGCLAGIGLLVGSDALTSVALVPVAILVVAFLVVWLGVLVGLVLAFVGRGRVPQSVDVPGPARAARLSPGHHAAAALEVPLWSTARVRPREVFDKLLPALKLAIRPSVLICGSGPR